MTAPAPAFKGVPPDGLAFLAELAAMQDRAWFEANKPRYEASLRAPLAALVEALAAEFLARGVPLTGDAKRSAFRLHRDVRFSKDKSPYKTHAGLVLFRPGAAKEAPGMLYVHVHPGACFMAAAFYHPEPDVLAALRAGIRARPEAFAAIARVLRDAGAPVEGEALTRLPRGFEDMAGSEVADFLKLKSLITRRALTDKQLQSPKAVGRIADFAEVALPLLRFGWTATDEVRGLDQAGRLAKFLPKAG